MKPNKTAPLVVSGNYTLIRRTNGTFYSHNKVTLQRQSLKTRNKNEAIELINALNKEDGDRRFAERMVEIYQEKAGRAVSKITWAEAMEECSKVAGKTESTRLRHRQAYTGKDFNSLRSMTICQTYPEHFRLIVKCGKPSVIKYLRKLQSFSIEQGWLTTPILASKSLRVIKLKEKRAIKREEYLRVIENEPDAEKRAFYSMLWATGASQVDCANLRVENFDREARTLVYTRQKTACVCRLKWNGGVEKLLDSLPQQGFLFPKLQKLTSSARAAEFRRRCRTKGVNVEGTSLHSFRYSMAERLAEAGFSIREASAALGHRSEAVHLAYAKKAEIFCSAIPEE
ncbi:tyrosine-type recombinase/integrase [Luteolibacter sp. LG18]|uniref:tyrosine-type recombinase/integrase n=1 Tax=Luteolibacter sp. LG18 TaxID=2819286 RepID=UPI002B2F091E|nr:hypothetical protein llg_28470 [Luteolibacter sp. LG18]